MKKTFHNQNEVSFYERQGKTYIWDAHPEEIVEFVNNGFKNESSLNPYDQIVWQELCGWMTRYLNEGVTESFLNGLNAELHSIRFSKYVLPLDLMPSESGYPRSVYSRKNDENLVPEALAADEFSKLLTSGLLKRLKKCRLPECNKFFLGPPQAKWCSKSCGSTFRVRKKRKRDTM